MHLHPFLPFPVLFSLLALTAAAPAPQATSAPSTFYQAPNTFTPTATGNTAVPGSVLTIINTAGAGSVSDTFVYTAALSTVAPTGNVTISPTGAAATQGNLQPDPKNLQTAAARRTAALPLLGASTGGAVVFLALAVGAIGGCAVVM